MKTCTVTTYIPGEWVSLSKHTGRLVSVSGLTFLEVVSPPLADLFLLLLLLRLLRLVPSALDLWFGPRRRA